MLIKLADLHGHLTETEQEVIQFLNRNVDKISSMSISDVAEATYSSPATVSRTVKKCGISGFAELRYIITQQSKSSGSDDLALNEIFNKSLLEVTNTIERLSIDTILSVVRELGKAERIYMLSRGLTEHVADEFCLKLQLLGFNVLSNSDPSIMQEICNHVKKNELVVIFSLSGQTAELVHAAENARSLGVPIICITCGAPDVPLARMANVTVFGYKHRHVSIKAVDATSRLPLSVISRIIIDYLTQQMEEKKKTAAAKEAVLKQRHYYQKH